MSVRFMVCLITLYAACVFLSFVFLPISKTKIPREMKTQMAPSLLSGCDQPISPSDIDPVNCLLEEGKPLGNWGY